jgi:phospholipid/cholesterol/gamma-HCH transport system substrate-binding protein
LHDEVEGAQQSEEDEEASALARVVAGAALVFAAAAIALLFVVPNNKYTVTARFENASQLVPGNLVQSAGRKVGLVKDIELTDDGLAEVTMEIDDDFAPLRVGTVANARQASQAGQANRYVELHMPSGMPAEIPDGGVIDAAHTTSQVDLDQVFNTFDARTRKGLTRVIRGFGEQYAGRGPPANRGWRYLNPSLVGADRLFRELNRDTPLLQRFLVAQSKLVTDVADRRDALAALIDRLATTTGAIASEDEALATAVGRLPPFMNQARATFVNLRSTLDAATPLVDESKPVAKLLRPVVAELRPLAQSARPTVHALADLIRRAGDENDLLELAQAIPPFRDVAIGPVQANGKERLGSFPAATESLRRQTPIFAFLRPYGVDLTGWFDDFSHSGSYDANGSFARSALNVNAFAAANGLLTPIPPALRDAVLQAVAQTGQGSRCPGSMERDPGDRSTPYVPSGIHCDPKQVPLGE